MFINYGEELAYWYLRLNGFFPITNFVLHRSEGIEYPSDVDVLAVRPPFVFEEVGGQPDDWDRYLVDALGFGRTLGLVCEVKTGVFKEGKLFRAVHIRHTLQRLGMVPERDVDYVAKALADNAMVKVSGGVVAKLFVSQDSDRVGAYLHRSVAQLEKFLVERIHRYPTEKFGDRMFFPSTYFQATIDRVVREMRKRGAA